MTDATLLWSIWQDLLTPFAPGFTRRARARKEMAIMDDGQNTDLEALEASLSGRIAQSTDEAALEAVRVEALGKAGSISALMKTLGTMSPDERKTFGPKLNGLRDRVTDCHRERKCRNPHSHHDILPGALSWRNVTTALRLLPRPSCRFQ